MVRFEKLLWETAVNSHTLRRGRSLASPSKWFSENRQDSMQVAGQKVFLSGISGSLFKLIEPIVSRFTYKWWQELAHQRGLALEDFFLHQDRELRRCVFFEKMVRDSCHPYQWIFMKKRRARFYKVERALRGSFMPEWAQAEAKARTFGETCENKDTWENFVYREYMSEQTPAFRWSVLGKWSVLDIIIPHGLWKVEAWDRYFLNETQYDCYTEDTVNASFAAVYPQDLSTSGGRSAFEAQVNGFIATYPNSIVGEGKQFDFQKFYAQVAVAKGKEVTGYSQSQIDDLKNELVARDARQEDEAGSLTGSAKVIGTAAPKFIQPAEGKGYF